MPGDHPQTAASAEEFVRAVLKDGRYVSTYKADPRAVADALGIGITDQIAADVLLVDVEKLASKLSPVSLIGQIGGDAPFPPTKQAGETGYAAKNPQAKPDDGSVE